MFKILQTAKKNDLFDDWDFNNIKLYFLAKP